GCIAQTSAQRSCRQRDGLHQAAVGGATPGSLHGGGDALPNRPGLTPSAVEKVRAPCRQECAWGGWASGSFVGGRTSSAPPPCGECAQRGNISDAYPPQPFMTPRDSVWPRPPAHCSAPTPVCGLPWAGA